MRAQTHLACVGLFILILLTGCGPGPALGLGPALDPLVSLIIVGALVVGGYRLVKSAANSPEARPFSDRISATTESVRDYIHEQSEPKLPMNAEEILRERYARGEIDRKQYLDMTDDVRKK